MDRKERNKVEREGFEKIEMRKREQIKGSV
jgi:hypothetical protein